MSIHRALRVREALDRAELWLDAGLHADALRAVAEARRADPDEPTARLIEARIQLRSANARHAMAALDVHDHLCPQRKNSPEVATLRAEALVASGQLDLALSLLRNLSDRFPDDARFHRRLAGVYLCMGRLNDAADELRELLRLTPGDSGVRRVLSGLIAGTHPDEGIRVLEESRDAGDDRTRLRLAQLCRKVGRLREAEEYLLGLLAENEDDADLLAEAGLVADELGASDLAIQRLRGAVRIRTDDAGLRLWLARLLMHAGRFAEAGRVWWALARRHEALQEAWPGVLVCAVAAGRQGLVRRVERVLERRGAPAERRRWLAQQWQHAAAPLAGLDHRASQDVPSPLVSLLHESAGKLGRAAQRFPGRADVHYHHAICAEAQGRAVEARTAADTALRINPSYAAAQRLSSRLVRLAA